MRLRNKPWTAKFLAENDEYLISWNHEQTYLDLASVFVEQDLPINLEIGCGKGNFITQHALLDPTSNFIGMEKETTVVGVALKKSIQTFASTNKEIVNLKYFNYYAEDLSKIFKPASIDKIYLNFSDPWPKTKHEKKRLTHNIFLNIYAQIIKSKGILEFKTDNDTLFAFSLEQIANNPNWELCFSTTDLYQDQDSLINNIPTEYETKFHNLNKNINKLIIQKTF